MIGGRGGRGRNRIYSKSSEKISKVSLCILCAMEDGETENNARVVVAIYYFPMASKPKNNNQTTKKKKPALFTRVFLSTRRFPRIGKYRVRIITNNIIIRETQSRANCSKCVTYMTRVKSVIV